MFGPVTRRSVAALFALVSCGPPEPLPGELKPEWQAILRHDSLVIDSLSRLVNTDSLYRLNHALITATDIPGLLQAAACEQSRLVRRHGVRPLELALRRMEDTLWKNGPADGNSRIASRITAPGMVTVGERACGSNGPVRPESVDGVMLCCPPSYFDWEASKRSRRDSQ